MQLSKAINKLSALDLPADAFKQVVSILTDLSKSDARKSRKSSRGTILPIDWFPAPKHFTQGAELGLTDQDVQRMAEDMRVWAGANSNRAIARKKDWDLTFTGWLRRNRPSKNRKQSFLDIALNGVGSR